MNKIKEWLIPILIGIILIMSITSCVMILAISDTVDKLKDDDKQMMEQMQGNLHPPVETPKLSDSTAFYKSESKTLDMGFGKEKWIRIHRFFFKRAEFTDSLYSGFSIIVADFGSSGVIIESQENVTVSVSNLGDKIHKWQSKLNLVTLNKPTYSDLSDDGLKVRTFVRSNKF